MARRGGNWNEKGEKLNNHDRLMLIKQLANVHVATHLIGLNAAFNQCNTVCVCVSDPCNDSDDELGPL
jgi:hypothetical protein